MFMIDPRHWPALTLLVFSHADHLKPSAVLPHIAMAFAQTGGSVAL